MSKNEKYYGCYECATEEGDGCVIFQFGINPLPIVCPCGYAYPRYILITDKIKEKLIKLKKC